jgi:hypothetical protein
MSSNQEDNMKAIVTLLALLPAATYATAGFAAGGEEPRSEQVAPIQLALWNPLQTSNENARVHGFRLNLPYGVNREVQGFDLGIASRTSGNQYGLNLGGGSYVGGDMRGAQLNFAVSIAHGRTFGLQEAIYNQSGSLYGVQSGLVNRIDGVGVGARLAAVNLSDNSMEGAEFGFVNHARRVRGLQLGVVNVASELHGVQIGALNFAKNGFLPFFPLINSAM